MASWQATYEDPVHYDYCGVRVFKTVGFYLCEYVAGDTADHDHEVDDARWMPIEQARTELTYPGEREMIERALSKHSGAM